MHISKEFLMEAVGMSLLVALILIGVQMFQRAIKITALLEKEQEQKIIELEEYEIVKYDDLKIDGMTAVNYIKKMIGTYELPVYVEEEERAFLLTRREEFDGLRDMDSGKYISPLVTYRCEVIRDENEVITSIRLIRE